MIYYEFYSFIYETKLIISSKLNGPATTGSARQHKQQADLAWGERPRWAVSERLVGAHDPAAQGRPSQGARSAAGWPSKPAQHGLGMVAMA